MARDDYWTRRALADEAAAERLARQAAKEMRRVYREQYEAVLRKIEGLMAEVAEGGTPTRTQLWNYARWRRLEERLREFAGEASRRCEQTVTDCLDEVFRTVIGADVADVTGTVWQASISPKAVLETAWSGEHYSTRIWRNTAAIAQRVRDDVTDMIVQGKGISQVRRRLMEDFSAAYSDADRLVRTEAAYVRNQAALTRYRQNGRRKVRWITGESDGRECSVCRERDGKEYDIDAAPRLPAHPNCRCCYAPVVEAGLTQRGENGTIESSRGSGFSDAETRLTKVIPPDRISNPMDLERYNKMREGLARQGISVVAAKGDDLRYLRDGIEAEATYSHGYIMHIGEIPSASALFEEIIHATQAKRYGEMQEYDLAELAAREVAANRKLLAHGGAYGFDETDFEDIRRNLDYWEKKYMEVMGVEYGKGRHHRDV